MKITEVGKYRVEQLIGSGSYGKVYRGRHRQTNELVALKIIERKGKNKREFDNLRQEIEILKKLNHPNIVLLKDHVETDNLMILIMEYAPKDLAGVLHEATKFKEEAVRKYAIEIVSALMYLNENRIVHRDLKPQNILLNEEGAIKICDFGFARKMSAATVCLHSMKGTPLYIAPEIIEQKPYGPKIDVWSLGIIMYELFTGIPPFFSDTFQKLAVKIINDKIIYPGNMSVEFREVVDGMLQKNPSNRYDWVDIQKHPFFNPPKITEAIKIVESEIPAAELNQFSMIVKSYELSLSVKMNDGLTIQVMREHEKALKQGGARHLKTDMVFYHQLVSMFMMAANGEKVVDTELLTVSFKVVILLINKVKLEEAQADNEITKKKDLLLAIVKLIGVVQDTQCLTQLFTLCCYLLKSSFSSNSKQVDADLALDIIQPTSKLLQKPQIPLSLLNPTFKTLGTLAMQVSLTIRNSYQIFKIACEYKLLRAIAARFVPEKDYSIIFECLEKFVYPIDLETYTMDIRGTVAEMRKDAAEGLLGKINTLPAVAGMYSKGQFGRFFHVIYSCIKVSPQFCQACCATPSLKPLLESNRLYCLAINYALYKSQNKHLLDINKLNSEIESIPNDLATLFQIILVCEGMKSRAVEQSTEKIKVMVRKIGEMLAHEYNWDEVVRDLEGWPVGFSEYVFADLAVQTVFSLYQMSKSVLSTIKQAQIIQNTIPPTKSKVNLQPKTLLNFALIAYQYTQAFGIEQPTFELLKHVILVILSEQTVGHVIQSQQSTQLLHSVLQLICKLIAKDQNQLTDFFTQIQAINAHRIFFIDSLLNERQLLLTLKVVTRLLKKCDSSIYDYIAVQGFVKLKPFLTTKNYDLLARLLHLLSTLARAKADFYPKIESLGIVELMSRYLSEGDINIRVKAMNLVGNLTKHSNYFIPQFMKHNIAGGIIGTLNGCSHQNLVYQAVFAIGNIAYFTEIPQSIIAPLIPYLYEALSLSTEAFLCNTIASITHLARHSGQHIKVLLDSKIIAKILQILQQTKNSAVQVRSLNCLDKLTQRAEMTRVYSGDSLKVQLNKIKPINSEAKDKIQKIADKFK